MSRHEQIDNGRIVMPIPSDAPPWPKHREHGEPSTTWTYTDLDGRPVAHVLRFDFREGETARKAILPLTLWDKGGRLVWQWKGLEAPRPLYRLDRIMRRTDAPVLVCEGEKTADAAARLFPDMVATTSLNGAMAVGRTDWTVLKGRRCVIAPDLDDPGTTFRDAVVEALRAAGAAYIEILDVAALSQVLWRDGKKQMRPPETVPEGYDLADAAQDGWTAERISAALAETPGLLHPAGERSSAQIREEPDDDGLDGLFEVNTEGVWKIVETYNKKTKTTSEERHWVCSPLTICGLTRDATTRDWGRLVRFDDPDGNQKTLVLPMQEFAGGGAAVIKRLMSHGLLFVPTRSGRDHLIEYLMRAMPKARVLYSAKPGWVGDSFALPGVSFGPQEIHCDPGEVGHAYGVAGCPDAWRGAAALAKGNSRLVLALSAAFAGPLIRPLNLEGGGFHFVGAQGDGKTTALHFAGSVWGGSDAKLGYLRSWNGSSSGHEGVAVLANDTLLGLDEIGEADPGFIGQILYMQWNGGGKNRADIEGRLKQSASWRCFVLSTGEKTVGQAISENARGMKPMAGQLVRLLDIPADAGAGMGIFETLNGFRTPRDLAMHLHQMSQHNYGHAARQFLEKLTAEIDESCATARVIIKHLVEELAPEGTSRQCARAAAQFGLVAAAGELATAFGVLPLDPGEALEAARTCFQAWQARQGDARYAPEHLEAIRAVQRYISLHGNSRFEVLRQGRVMEDGFDRPIQNRAGYRKMVEDGTQYIILPEILRSEVCRGLSPEYVVSCLRSEGLLDPGENGRAQKKVRIPDQAHPIRAYVLKPGVLSWPHHDAEDAPDEEFC